MGGCSSTSRTLISTHSLVSHARLYRVSNHALLAKTLPIPPVGADPLPSRGTWSMVSRVRIPKHAEPPPTTTPPLSPSLSRKIDTFILNSASQGCFWSSKMYVDAAMTTVRVAWVVGFCCHVCHISPHPWYVFFVESCTAHTPCQNKAHLFAVPAPPRRCSSIKPTPVLHRASATSASSGDASNQVTNGAQREG